MQYVCSQLSSDMQTCTAWTEQAPSTLDQFAITRDQAHQLTQDIVLILIIAYCFVLFKRFVMTA